MLTHNLVTDDEWDNDGFDDEEEEAELDPLEDEKDDDGDDDEETDW